VVFFVKAICFRIHHLLQYALMKVGRMMNLQELRGGVWFFNRSVALLWVVAGSQREMHLAGASAYVIALAFGVVIRMTFRQVRSPFLLRDTKQGAFSICPAYVIVQ